MKCIKCGARLDDNMEFCGNCGTKVIVKKSKSKKLVVILGLLLVAIIVGGCFLMLRKKQKSFPEVEATLSKYFDAVENFDYETMVKLTINDDFQSQGYQNQLINMYNLYSPNYNDGPFDVTEIYFLYQNEVPSIYTSIWEAITRNKIYTGCCDFINDQSKKIDLKVQYKINNVYQPDEISINITRGHGRKSKKITMNRKEYEEYAFDGKVDEWYLATIDLKWYINGYLYGFDTELEENILNDSDEYFEYPSDCQFNQSDYFRQWLNYNRIISYDKEERVKKVNEIKDRYNQKWSDYPVVIYKYEGEWYLKLNSSNTPSIWENSGDGRIDFEVVDTKHNNEKNIDDYSENDKVQSDIQLVKTIKTAMETATMDAAVANEPDYVPFEEGDGGIISELSRGGTTFMSSFNECCGVNNPSELNDKIMSTLGKEQGEIEYYWVSDSSVVVYINNTYRYGSLEKHKISRDDCECIYAGPTELLPYDFVGSY